MIRFFSRLVVFWLVVFISPLWAQESAPAGKPAVSSAGVAVLGYGAFAVAEGMDGITAAAFEVQMNYLKARGITPVSLEQFINWQRRNIPLPEKSVLITLDEADVTAYSVAFPVLRKLGYPFVVFVDERSFQDSAVALDAARLREMQQAGASIGSRSMSRPQACDWQYAASAGPDASLKMAEFELGLPAQRITAAFGSCDAFSYPRGYANAHIVENLAVYGYKVAFGMRAGKVQQHSPAYMLNRYMVRDMPGFARAVNFGPEAEDSLVLQQIHEHAARHLPVSRPVVVASPEAAAAVFPPFSGQEAVSAAELPPLPPAVDPLTGQPVEQGGGAPIPAPVILEDSGELLADPVLTPRPVCSTPAAGQLTRRSNGADWTTIEFPHPVVPRDKTRVAVLGYHNFSNTRPVSEMRMRTSEFCQQMQYIQDAGLTVITMQDFLDWLLGNRCLPERCVLITIDDGWRSVYTDAYPVLKAYGYPFTLFLYTTYLSGKGQSMEPGMVREMMAAGATIGSHSTTHLYPSQWKRFAQDSPEYAAQLQQEFPDSVAALKELFGACSTFCYPGGYHTPPMLDSLRQCGVQAAFTVLEKKVTTLENPLLVHRYMVFGTDPRIFRRAVNFDDVAGIKPTAQGITEARERAMAFFPAAFGSTPPPPAASREQPPAQGPLSAPAPSPAPKAELEDIPAPSYTVPSA